MMRDIGFSLLEKRICSMLRFCLLWIDHHPMDDEVSNVLPRACERGLRGQILACVKHLVQRNGGQIGPAHLLGQNKLDEGIEVRSEERRVGKECRSRWSPYH